MDAIMLYLKKRGIRFFRNIKFKNTKVRHIFNKEDFFNILNSRINEFDNVIIIAHGAPNGILTTTNNPNHQYRTYISLDETKNFHNDFVFAISCSTANEFGQHCIADGAIAYLGYLVEIGGLFSSFSKNANNVPKRINTDVDTIIKHIFCEEVCSNYERFLREPISVQVLKEMFSYNLEKRVSSLLDKNPLQIYEEYNILIPKDYYQKYFVKIVLQVLSILDEVINRLVCLGDCNYISASYLSYRKTSGISSQKMREELEQNTFYKKIKSDLYKAYLYKLIEKF